MLVRALFAALVLAPQAVVPTAVAPVEGSVVHALRLTVDVMGREAVIGAKLKTTSGEAKEGAWSDAVEWNDLAVTLDGNAMPFESAPMTLERRSDGALLSAKGGVQGADSYATALLLRFAPPKAAPAPGDAFVVEYPADEARGLAAQKVESVYVGPKDGGFEFRQKTTMGSFRADVTLTVDAGGRVQTADGKFDGLPIPAANVTAPGTVSAKIAP